MTEDLYYFNLLPKQQQHEAITACRPIPQSSRRRKLTAQERRQLPIDLERWAERWLKRRQHAREWLHAPTIGLRISAMKGAEAVEEMARKVAGTKFSFYELTIDYLRERHPQKQRPVMILLGVDVPNIVGVN